MELVKQVGSFFGWLSGVLAGLAAILYGLGFIATSAHQRALGMSWSGITRDPLTYLELGGQIAASWLLWGTLALMLAAVVVALGRTLLRLVRGRDPWGYRQRLGSAIGRQTPWLVAALLIGLASLSFVSFDNALEAPDLLFASDSELCAQTGARGELARGDSGELRKRASMIFLTASMSLCLVGFAAPRLLSAHAPVIPTVICAGAALTAIAMVPVAHGIFAQPMALPEVHPSGEMPGALPAEGLRLIATARDGIWIWDPASGDVHWLASGLPHLRFTPPRPLRQLACPSDHAAPPGA